MKTPTNAMPPDGAIWLFDSQCVLCDGAVQYTLRHEKAPTVRFVSIQSKTGIALALAHGLDPQDPRTFLFITPHAALERSDGVIALAGHLRGPARLIRLARFMPKPLRDFAYDIIARNRYRLFGRTDTCIMPTARNRHRFSL